MHHSAADSLHSLLQSSRTALDTPAARAALQQGVLRAKQEALHAAERLLRLGPPLLIGVLAVSFVHVFDTIAAIKPASIPALLLPAWAYHATAAALTLGIDAVALYAVASSSVVALAVAGRRLPLGLLFFLATTFLLNAAFVLAYAPSLSADIRAATLPRLELLFAVLIPATIPVALLTVERAIGQLRLARLHLLVEVTALAEIAPGTTLTADPVAVPQNRSASVLVPDIPSVSTPAATTTRLAETLPAPSPISGGGRPQQFSVTHLTEALRNESVFGRQDVMSRLGCADATADRLLGQAVQSGLLIREKPGLYAWAADSTPGSFAAPTFIAHRS